MEKKADAFARYGEAAVLEMLVQVLPEVVDRAAAPLSAVQKMTVVSTDGAGQLPRAVAGNVAQGLELMSATTGIDLAELLRGLTAKAAPAAVPDRETALNGAAAAPHRITVEP